MFNYGRIKASQVHFSKGGWFLFLCFCLGFFKDTVTLFNSLLLELEKKILSLQTQNQ